MRSTWHRDILAAVSLCAAAACAPTESATTEAPGSATEAPATTTGAPETGTDATTGPAPTSSSSSEGETDAPGTTTSEAPTSATGTTGEPALEYCQGFDAGAPAPFLELYDLAGQALAEGGALPLECGGQGAWMFGLYPKLGGWDPQGEIVVFDMTVDVAGHNTNPAGHFYSSESSYYIGCEPVIGGVLGVAPVFPPDDLADLAELDGLPAQVHVEVDAGGQALGFDATMTLVAPPAVLAEGCVPKG